MQGYANRFPMAESTFSVPTLAEEIELIQGMNKSTGKNVGIYPEIKGPEFHRRQEKTSALLSLECLNPTATPASKTKYFSKHLVLKN